MKFTRLQLIVICISVVGVLAGIFRTVLPEAPTPVADAPVAGELTGIADVDILSDAIKIADTLPAFTYQLIEKPDFIELAEAGTDGTAESVDRKNMININAAGHALLQKLPRVGKKTAQSIIEYRTQVGGFKNLHQLKEIQGIGDKTLNKIQTMAYCGPMGESFDPVAEVSADKPSPKKHAPPPDFAATDKININTAGEAELVSLPRIGPATARKIIADRETNGSFATVDDLTRVSGIGKKTLANLRPLIKVD